MTNREDREALKDRLTFVSDDDLFEILSSVIDADIDEVNQLIEDLREEITTQH